MEKETVEMLLSIVGVYVLISYIVVGSMLYKNGFSTNSGTGGFAFVSEILCLIFAPFIVPMVCVTAFIKWIKT